MPAWALYSNALWAVVNLSPTVKNIGETPIPVSPASPTRSQSSLLMAGLPSATRTLMSNKKAATVCSAQPNGRPTEVLRL